MVHDCEVNSLLCMPIKNFDNVVIAVVQAINKTSNNNTNNNSKDNDIKTESFFFDDNDILVR